MITTPYKYLVFACTLIIVAANANARKIPHETKELTTLEQNLIESFRIHFPQKVNDQLTWVRISKSGGGILMEGQLSWKKSELNNIYKNAGVPPGKIPMAVQRDKDNTISVTNMQLCNFEAVKKYNAMGGVMKVAFNTADAHEFASLTVSCTE
ncbi:MAG: hypothetical protein V6Z81_07565 [Parvularculales bacterium]